MMNESLLKYGQTAFDEYLHKIGEKLQLSSEQRKDIENNYAALSSYIEKNSELLEDYDEIRVYPQGSYALETVIKPLKSEQFDIDIVVEFPKRNTNLSPQQFYDSLLQVFSGESRYSKIVEAKNRCVRINYLSTNYYFDILPVVPSASENMKRAPDKKLKSWVRTSPIKYREWFESKSRQRAFLEDMALEKLPKNDQPFPYKPALKRAVQLIKRARDIYFKDDDTFAPSSIVLTTLFAQSYNGERSTFEALKNILSKLKTSYKVLFTLNNPVDPLEEFTEKWKGNISYYTKYQSFINSTLTNLLILENSQGIHQILRTLSGIFGESVTKDIIGDYKLWHENRVYGVTDEGVLTSENIVKPAKKNNFHG